jgi:hypothetical protein
MINKPKLSTYKAIQKSMILWGIENDEELRIYYRWNLEKRKRPVKTPCLVVDYNKDAREWYIFFYSDEQILSCTIDDVTGTGSIKTIE